jgi:PIN domain nuclease of toxin-antitoxin system
MNILLDTCTFLWMIDDVGKLGPQVRSALEDASNRVILHQVSSWEIQIKYDLGKLPLTREPQSIIRDGLQSHAIEYQTLQDEEIWQIRKLPPIHGDPFDRILIACALSNGLRLASPDPQVAKYPVQILW